MISVEEGFTDRMVLCQGQMPLSPSPGSWEAGAMFGAGMAWVADWLRLIPPSAVIRTTPRAAINFFSVISWFPLSCPEWPSLATRIGVCR